MITEIKHEGELIALILPGEFSEPGIHFFTPESFSQQLAYMKHPSGKIIPPHLHNPVLRQVQRTLEVLFIRKGRLRVDFYDNERHYFESRVLRAGDIILLVTGGHGFEVLEEIEMVEVKQGPFVGEVDKVRFDGITAEKINLKP